MSQESSRQPSEDSGKPSAETPPERAGNESAAGATKRRPRGFVFVAILLAVLLVIAAFHGGPEGYGADSIERNTSVAVEWFRAGKIDLESMFFIKDKGTFRARLTEPEGKANVVEVRFATEDLVNQFYAETIAWHNAQEGNKVVDWTVKDSQKQFWQFVAAIAPWILFFVIIYFLFFRQLRAQGGPGGNILSFGKSRAKLQGQKATGVTFDDVAGIDVARDEVQEIVEFLKNPQKFQRLGGRIPRGVMLVGPPGTGKTLLAKAIAGEADVPFFSICGSDFVEMFVGVGAARVRDLFKQARESSPCLLFLDEVDAVGRRRGSGLGGGHDEREQTLNAILVEMDGFDSDEGIILIAATNRPDVLDPALLRPGRFDREIYIDPPDLGGREAILNVHAKKVKLSSDVDMHRVARGTPGFSGAELAALINEAAIVAAMRDQDSIREIDLEDARDKIRFGLQKKSWVPDEEDRRVTAYHEAGHALIAHLLPEVEPLHKVSIIPRGMALGLTMQLPERDRYSSSKTQLLGQLKLLYGGRIAEQKFCGEITSGAANDIERATELVRRMVTEWGMSEAIGPIRYSENQETLFLGREVTKSSDHSEEIALRIDEEVRRTIDECYKFAEELIEENREAMERIAAALLERETLSGEEVAQLVRGEPLPPVELETTSAPPQKSPEVRSQLVDDVEPTTDGATGVNPGALPA